LIEHRVGGTTDTESVTYDPRDAADVTLMSVTAGLAAAGSASAANESIGTISRRGERQVSIGSHLRAGNRSAEAEADRRMLTHAFAAVDRAGPAR
jgi:hypothetical protein